MEPYTEKVSRVFDTYKKEHPDLDYAGDYLPLKITEEWGECMQAYLMMTGRGRDKGLSEEELRKNFQDELADIFGFLLILAKEHNIDMETALKEKWFKYLK